MPKTSRGGKAGTTTAPRGRGVNPGGVFFTPQQQQVRAQASHFQPATPAQAQQIQQQQQTFLSQQNINVKYAVMQYIRADQQANGRSRSQNLNNKLETGTKLDATEKQMVKYLDAGMSPIGQDVMLVRADHAITNTGSGLMDKLGVQNYQSMSSAQLQQALVGRTWNEKKYLSTSTNVKNNPFISGSQAGGRAVIMKISAKGSTKMVIGDVSQSEYILARGGNYRITGARFTGKTVYPAQGGSYKQIEIDVETL